MCLIKLQNKKTLRTTTKTIPEVKRGEFHVKEL